MKNMSAFHVVCNAPTDAYREGWERAYGASKRFMEGSKHIVVAYYPDGRVSVDGDFLKPGETIHQKLDELDGIAEKQLDGDAEINDKVARTPQEPIIEPEGDQSHPEGILVDCRANSTHANWTWKQSEMYTHCLGDDRLKVEMDKYKKLHKSDVRFDNLTDEANE